MANHSSSLYEHINLSVLEMKPFNVSFMILVTPLLDDINLGWATSIHKLRGK